MATVNSFTFAIKILKAFNRRVGPKSAEKTMLKGQAKPAPFSLSESVLLGKEIFLVQSYLLARLTKVTWLLKALP